MASEKKPTLKKYPKTPPKNASLERIKAYSAKCSEIDKQNKAMMDAYYSRSVQKIDLLKKAKNGRKSVKEGISKKELILSSKSI